MSDWIKYTNYIESDCLQYRITNAGKKGGDSYVLWTKKYDCFCFMLAMGTFEHCKEKYKLRKEI